MRRALLIALALPALIPGTAAAAPRAGRLELLAEPAAGIGPFLTLIADARHRVDLVIYELRDRSVERALAAARARGLSVRVLLDRTYAGAADNAAAYAYLTAHRVPVRWAPAADRITHEKTLIVDSATAAIMTLNFDGLTPSTRDFAVLDRQGADIRAIEATFDADWSGTPIVPGDGTGDLVWSPHAAPRLLSLIDGARSSIELENEEIDYRPATAALCAAARRGVDVQIVMTASADWADALTELSGCGAHVRLYHGQGYYIHAKLLEVDGDRALVGSQNLSTASLTDNRELGIILTARPLLGQLSADFTRDYRGAPAATR